MTELSDGPAWQLVQQRGRRPYHVNSAGQAHASPVEGPVLVQTLADLRRAVEGMADKDGAIPVFIANSDDIIDVEYGESDAITLDAVGDHVVIIAWNNPA